MFDGLAHEAEDAGGVGGIRRVAFSQLFAQDIGEICYAAKLLAKAVMEFLREAAPFALAEFE